VTGVARKVSVLALRAEDRIFRDLLVPEH